MGHSTLNHKFLALNRFGIKPQNLPKLELGPVDTVAQNLIETRIITQTRRSLMHFIIIYDHKDQEYRLPARLYQIQ